MRYGRMYTASFAGVTVSAAQDFFEFTGAAGFAYAIHEVEITQDADETSQQLPVSLLYIPATVTGGSGGSTATPRRRMRGDSASGATVEINNTTPATSSGTIETLDRKGDNALNGWRWLFTPEDRIIVPPSGVFCVRLITAPSSGIAMSGKLTFEEIG